MGVCTSKLMPMRARDNTDSSIRTGNHPNKESKQEVSNSSIALGEPDEHQQRRPLLKKQTTVTTEDDPDEYFDAIEEEERFLLTLSKKHHYAECDGLESQIAEAIRTKNKDGLKNAFTDPPAELFMVRGPDYLKDGKGGRNMKDLKVPSKQSPYELFSVNMFRSPIRIKSAGEQIGVIRRFLEERPADLKDALFPQFLIVNWIMSPLFGRENFLVQHVFRLRSDYKNIVDKPLSAAFTRFKAGDDTAKNTQLKYVFRVVDAPAAVRNTITYLGGERPVLIGKQLTTSYVSGKNYMEVNMDISSSKIASLLNGFILKNVETVVMDCSWLLEGQLEEELPERVLCKVRWIWNSTDDVIVKLNQSGEVALNQS
jgi:hypothetical protein